MKLTKQTKMRNCSTAWLCILTRYFQKARRRFVLSALKTTQFRVLFTGHKAGTLSMNNNNQHHLGNFKVSH